MISIFYLRTFLICAVSLVYFGCSSTEQPYDEEEFSFRVNNDSLVLSGSLIIPSSFQQGDRVIVMVSPPQANSRDYYNVFKVLADTLGKRGTAVLRFDNRAFVDTNSLHPKETTIYTQKADALNALDALKADPRFEASPIGLLGHSEGALAVVMAAAERRDISFVVLLATPGVNGLDVAYNQGANRIMRAFPTINQKEKESSLTFLYNNLKIIAENKNIDSLKYHMDNLIRKGHASNPKKFGKQTVDEAIETNRRMFLMPRQVALVQFKPTDYYPDITCPTLVVYGKNDELLDIQSNLAGIDNLFKSSKKRNYMIVTLDSLGHTFQRTSDRAERQSNAQLVSPDKKALEVIVDWLDKIKP